MTLPVIEMARLHPYQYTYFNRLAGGVRVRASATCSIIGGCRSNRPSQALAAKIAADKLQKPAGRPWKIAVCGPHRSPQVELGPDYDTSWDPQGADFAMMLGVFYCKEFDAPVIADIRREGVLYARIYDIRGRSYPTLLNLYPQRNF